MDKILEAILKGIQMGLEILDDELDLSIFQGSLITSNYHVDRVNQLRWVRENFVDLGLPSGTLWCKYNIGASCGDTPDSWYGGYYAWGELVGTKKQYRWSSYKFKCDSIPEAISTTLSKYNNHASHGEIDNKTTLCSEDDVVNVTMGHDATMPTVDDIAELSTLHHKWVKNHNGVIGLNGVVFFGNNGNELFIPAAGYIIGLSKNLLGFYVLLWTKNLTPGDSDVAYVLTANIDEVDEKDQGSRYYGRSVRGVLKIK